MVTLIPQQVGLAPGYLLERYRRSHGAYFKKSILKLCPSVRHALF
jgi:hypothetical protein